jgi:nitroreductase
MNYSKDILHIIKSRRSIRKYKAKQVAKDLIEKILEAARWTPSAINKQPWHFVIVQNPKTKSQISNKSFAGPAKNAPTVIVVCTNIKTSKWVTIDASLASQNIMLEAHSLGLGTCFVGAFDEETVRKVLGIPEEYKVIGLIALGYPDEEPHAGPRKGIEQISSLDKFEIKRSSVFRSGALSFVAKKLRK